MLLQGLAGHFGANMDPTAVVKAWFNLCEKEKKQLMGQKKKSQKRKSKKESKHSGRENENENQNQNENEQNDKYGIRILDVLKSLAGSIKVY